MYLLFDIGGTKMRFSSSVDGINIDGIQTALTPVSFEHAIQEFEKQYKAFSKIGRIDKVSGGLAAVLDTDRARVLSSYNLPQWNNQNFVKVLTEKFGCEVYLENDAALEGLGEAIDGAGKNNKIVAYITVGTGVGGARIVNKSVDAKNNAFEPGHQIIDYKNLSDLGDMVSGAGLKKKYGLEASSINDQKIWDESLKILAVGIHNTIVHWSPEIVVMGGSLITQGRYDIEKLNDEVKKISKTYPLHPKVVKAQLGDKAGLLGALHIAKFQHEVRLG